MRITPITYTYAAARLNDKNAKSAFTAHPDFYKFNSMQSCYFRRGVVVLPSKGYNDVEDTFCDVFKRNTQKPKKMLIIGVANSQETFSYMASIKGIIGGRPLKDTVDLHVVDLQSKPEKNKLKEDSYSDLLDYETYPHYAKKGFVKEGYSYWDEIYKEMDKKDPFQYYILEYLSMKPREPSYRDRVNGEIFDFVSKSYDNPKKSRWDSRVQDVLPQYPDRSFDVISANNVLPYINTDEEFLQTVNQIKRVLKKGGYFITDPYDYPEWMVKAGVLDSLREVRKGIYQKTC